jgi:hypothetical protein
VTSFSFQNPIYTESNGRIMTEEEVVGTSKQPVLMQKLFEKNYKTT